MLLPVLFCSSTCFYANYKITKHLSRLMGRYYTNPISCDDGYGKSPPMTEKDNVFMIG